MYGLFSRGFSDTDDSSYWSPCRALHVYRAFEEKISYVGKEIVQLGIGNGRLVAADLQGRFRFVAACIADWRYEVCHVELPGVSRRSPM